MEIKDPVHGTMEFSDPEVAVIETAEFQRLRSIQQLGFGEFSFPGATHTRFLHSLGVCYLAGEAFDHIFRNHQFTSGGARSRFRSAVRLAALLHDIGHSPLSHTTERKMPEVRELKIKVYPKDQKRRANHEDYTIKMVTDSQLTLVLEEHFQDLEPLHVVCLIDKDIPDPKDDFFMDGGLNYRTILSQLVSSELDCDRMDYLLRDSHFCGTNYGKVEVHWIISNLTHYVQENRVHLALNRRALYTFDDFLISRHHMYLMVYFHHKAIIFDEMLDRFLGSPDCNFKIPADIEAYLEYTDHYLYQHMAKSKNEWAQRITKNRPYRMLFELHATGESSRAQKLQDILKDQKIPTILASSETRLSKYHSTTESDAGRRIFVVDQYDRWAKPYAIEKSTEIFQKYEKARRIERIYVPPEKFTVAQKHLETHRF